MTATTTETDIAQLMAELATSGGQADPYPIYARVHELGEAVAAPDGTIVVTGYQACSDNRLRKFPRCGAHRGRLPRLGAAALAADAVLMIRGHSSLPIALNG
jgi:hypothetical protein